MAKDLEEAFAKIQGDEAKNIILKQQMRISELKMSQDSLAKEVTFLRGKIDEIKEWYKEESGSLDEHDGNQLKEILKGV